MASPTDSFLLEVEPGYAPVGFKLKTAGEERHTGSTDRARKGAANDKLQRNQQTVQATARQPAGGVAAEGAKFLARANSLINSGNCNAAIQHLEGALNSSSDAHLQKQIWRLLGNCHSSNRSYKKASVAYLHYLGMCRELGDFPGATRAYCCLGITFMNQGLYTLAGNCFLQHLDNSQIMKNKVALASAYNNLGVLAKLLGKKGIERAYRTGNTTTMSSVTSQLHRAISYFAEHLLLVEELHDRAKQCVAFGNLGACHEMLMEFPQAVHYHYQRLVLAHRLRDYRGQSRALCNIGNCLRAQGQLGEACTYYLKDLEVCQLIKDENGEIVALLNLATTTETLGDLHKAIEWHSLILGIRVKRDDKPGQAKSLMLLGALYYETEQLTKAKDYFSRVVDLSQILRDRELQVKSMLILEEIQTAIKKRKHSRYGSMRSSLRRFKRSPLKSMLPMHTHNSLPAKQLKYEPTPSINSRPQSLMLTGPGDAPVIKISERKDRVPWSPGLKRWVNESGRTSLYGDTTPTGWAPSPLVIQNALATHGIIDDHGSVRDDTSHFSIKDSVHGYLNDNKHLSYQFEDVLMSAAAKSTDRGVERELDRDSSNTSLYSRAFGSRRHIQELRVIGQDMCKAAVELGLSHGGEEWQEWVLSPNDDRRSLLSLPIDETMFDSQQQPHSTTHQTSVELEDAEPHLSSDQVQRSPTHNRDQLLQAGQEQSHSANRHQPHPRNHQSRSHDQHSYSHDQQPRSRDQQPYSGDHQPHLRDQQPRSRDQQSCSRDQQQPHSSDQKVHSHNRNPTVRPISPVDILEGVDAVISCLEAVLEDEDQSDDDES